ncbi:MAG: hypothetical protein AAFY26_02180, partial [Cyanobacteria bacterium J06638_22]
VDDQPVLDVSIEVNSHIQSAVSGEDERSPLDAGTVTDSREALRIALALRQRMRDFVQTLPDGMILTCSPWGEDGLGGERASLYERFGFTPPNEWEEQYGIVRGGKLTPITPRQVVELRQQQRGGR